MTTSKRNDVCTKLRVNRVFNYNYNIRKEFGQQVNIAVNQGGTSSGKTYAIIQLLFVLCINGEIMAEFQDSSHFDNAIQVRVIAKELTRLRNDALKIARSLNATVFRDFGIKENKSECKFSFPNGSEIVFIGLEDEEKAKNGKFHYTYISEATAVSYAVFEQAYIRTSVFTFIDYNPSKKFWAHIHLLEPDGDYHEVAKCIRSTYKDNEENLSSQTINGILHKASKDDNFRRVYLEGKLGRLETLVFPNYEIINQRPANHRLKNHFLGLDFGVNDPTTLVLTADYYDDNDVYLGVYIEELFYLRGLNTKQIIQNIIDSTAVWREQIMPDKTWLLYADSAGKLTISDIAPVLNQIKIQVYPATKGAGSIMAGIMHLKEAGIFINRRSKNTIDEFAGYEFIKDRNGMITDQPQDENNHAIDAAKYSRTKRMKVTPIERAREFKQQKQKSTEP